MRLSTLLFLASIAVSAAAALTALLKDDRSGFALFKPVTTCIALIGASWLVRPAAQPYASWVGLGLALSLAGDVLLLPQIDRFTAGLAAFLLAHLAYLGAFSLGNPIAPGQLPLLAPFAVAAVAVTRLVWPRLGSLRLPVLAYVTAVTAMAWRAAARGRVPGVPPASFLLALGGACLFMLSDAILAVRRFRLPSRPAHAVELGLYWIAQAMIALSVRM